MLPVLKKFTKISCKQKYVLRLLIEVPVALTVTRKDCSY